MLRLITERLETPDRDTALSSAILRRVADGRAPETLRLWVPQRTVAFGRQDTVRPGYDAAVDAAEAAGFAAVRRLAGGRAAVFHEGTIAFSWAQPEPKTRETITERFRLVSSLIRDAVASLGADARVGEIPGEYCPGDWSVNIEGQVKVMGVGQRLVRGAAHIGGVVVVSDADLINRPLQGVYAALEYEWEPAVTGALDRFIPRATVASVSASLLSRWSSQVGATREDTATADELGLADALAPDHSPRSR